MTTLHAKGAWYEEVAAAHLEHLGLIILDRNVSCRFGEIDLVLRDADVLVFCEVRYRSGEAYGGAIASIDQRKRRKLIAAARWYLSKQRAQLPCRFDVVAITGASLPQVLWIKDAFRVDG